MSDLRLWVICYDVSDHPGKYVVRQWRVNAHGHLHVSVDARAITDTLDEARQSIPEECVMFDRSPNDDRVIVETWV